MKAKDLLGKLNENAGMVESKEWTVNVGSQAGSGWSIKDTLIDDKGNVSIIFDTPKGEFKIKAGSGVGKNWKVKDSFIKGKDVFVVFSL